MFCPNCGHDCGDAKFCPECGFPLSQSSDDLPVDISKMSNHRKRRTNSPQPQQQAPTVIYTNPPRKRHGCLIAAIIVGIIVIIFLVLVANLTPKLLSTSSNQFTTSQTSVQSVQQAQSEEPPVPIGQEANNGKVSIKVNSVSETSKISDDTGYLYYSPSEGARFVLVNITARNVGNEMYSFVISNFQILDSSGNQYSPSVMVKDNYLNSGSINPGLSETGDIAFEVPKNVSLSDLKMEFSEFLSIDKADFALK